MVESTSKKAGTLVNDGVRLDDNRWFPPHLNFDFPGSTYNRDNWLRFTEYRPVYKSVFSTWCFNCAKYIHRDSLRVYLWNVPKCSRRKCYLQCFIYLHKVSRVIFNDRPPFSLSSNRFQTCSQVVLTLDGVREAYFWLRRFVVVGSSGIAIRAQSKNC